MPSRHDGKQALQQNEIKSSSRKSLNKTPEHFADERRANRDGISFVGADGIDSFITVFWLLGNWRAVLGTN